jgi:hypothetical protein
LRRIACLEYGRLAVPTWLDRLLSRRNKNGRKGGDMADDKRTEVYYRLARSIVRITGQVTTDFDPKTSEERESATCDIEVGVEADPRLDWRCRLPMGSKFMKDKQFELSFTADGRLKSSSATVSGAGAAIIEAGVRVVGFLGATALAAVAKQKPSEKARTFDQVLEVEQDDLFRRREAYRKAITGLQDELAANAERVAASPGAVGLLTEGRVVQGTLERVRSEAAQVEAQVDAWRHSRFPSSTEEHEFTVGTDALPQLSSATPEAEFDIGELAPGLRSAATQLGVVVARVVEVEEDALNFTPEDLVDESGIWFRTARPTNLAVYEREPGGTGAFKLRSVTPAWVVDSDSRLGFLRFDSGIFDKQTGALGFGDTGALTSLSSTDESPAKQLSAALAAAPGQIQESIQQAVAVSEGLAKLRAAGAEKRLADIERRRKLLEAEIAEKGVLATRAQREKLEELKVRAEVAEAEKKLAPEPPPAVSPNKELEAQLTRAKLELELRQAEVEMEWLQRESAELKPG